MANAFFNKHPRASTAVGSTLIGMGLFGGAVEMIVRSTWKPHTATQWGIIVGMAGLVLLSIGAAFALSKLAHERGANLSSSAEKDEHSKLSCLAILSGASGALLAAGTLICIGQGYYGVGGLVIAIAIGFGIAAHSDSCSNVTPRDNSYQRVNG